MKEGKYKILVIRFSSLGDIILTTPVLEALKEEHKNSEIFFLTKQRYKGIFESDPRVDSLIYFDSEVKYQGLSGLIRLIKRLNQEKFDLVIDLHSNIRSFLIRHLVKSQKKIRYNKRLFHRLLMVYLKKRVVDSISTVDSYLKCLEDIGINTFTKTPRLYPEIEKKFWAEKFLSQMGLENGEVMIGIAPGAKWETKRWDKDKFSIVSKTLSQDFVSKILLVGDENDQALVEDIKDYIGEEKAIKALNLSFDRLMTLVGKCELFISNDTGPMHLASALGVPTIGIFGPTSPALGFTPSGFNDKVFWAGIDCSPCSLHGRKGCVKESRFCMDRINPKEVVEEASRIINSDKAIFLDRDGTLTVEKDFVTEIEEIEFIPGIKEAMKIFQDMGYKIIIVSNQSGIGRGIMTRNQVEKINDFILDELEKEGINITGIYYCPHHPEDHCKCRKPKTGLVEKILLKHNLKIKDSWVIGDKRSDISLGRNIKGNSILVLTGYGQEIKRKLEAESEVYFWQKPDYVAKDILDAAQYLKSAKSIKIKNLRLKKSRIRGK